MWFATDRGIASFNGSYFTTYDVSDGLPDRVVFNFYPQKDGRIWCTTGSNELFHFHADSLKFHRYKYNTLLREDLLRMYQMRNLIVHDDGSIQFRSILNVGGYSISNTGELEAFDRDAPADINLDLLKICWHDGSYPYKEFLDPTKHDRYLKTYQRLNILSVNKALVLTFNDGIQIYKDNLKKKEIPSKLFSIASESLGDLFWIGKEKGGIELYDEDGNLLKKYNTTTTGSAFLIDKHKGVWVGTQADGVFYYPSTKVELIPQSNGQKILCVYKNQMGTLSYNTTNGYGHHFISSAKETITSLSKNYSPSLYHPLTDALYEAPSAPIPLVIKYSIGHASANRISDNLNRPPLFITYSKVCNTDWKPVFDTKLLQNKEKIQDAEYLKDRFAIARGNNVLIGKEPNKIIRKTNIGCKVIELDVYKDKIYCATEKKGVVVLDEKGHIIGNYTVKDGLPSNHIYEVLIDGEYIWVGTVKGLARIEMQSEAITFIRTENGLYYEEIMDMVIIKDTMYAGTDGGVFHFPLNQWNSLLTEQIPITFRKKDVLVNGTPVKSTKDLDYRSNEIEVQFDVVSFINSRGLSFRYKLIGLSNEWQETTDRKVVYRSLPPGDYELVIQPMFNGVPRDEEIRQKISISEVFYRTWWFLVIVIASVMIATWLFIRYRVVAYNRELIREILRFLMKRLKPKTNSFIVRSDGKNIRINSADIRFVESNGNYINIHTETDKITIREKISRFPEIVPDQLEYVRVRRSVIARKDKITGRNSEFIIIGEHEVKIGNTYRKELESLEL